MSQQLCSRQSLVSLRFNNVGMYPPLKTTISTLTVPDLLALTRTRDSLEKLELDALVSSQREGYLCWSINLAEKTRAYHKICVREFAPSGSSEESRHSTILVQTYAHSYKYEVPVQPAILVPESLPSIESLIQAGIEIDRGTIAGPLRGLHLAFGKFCNLYCDMRKDLPLVR